MAFMPWIVNPSMEGEAVDAMEDMDAVAKEVMVDVVILSQQLMALISLIPVVPS